MSLQPVWLNDPADPPFVYARCSFHLAEATAAAHLRCASTGEYLLYVNGTEQARGLRNVLSKDPVWQVADVEASLVPGDNELLLLLEAAERGQPSWFMAEGTVVTGAGKRVAIGRHWKMQPAAAWTTSDRHREILVYDAQLGSVPHGSAEMDGATWYAPAEVPTGGHPREWHPHNFVLRESFASTIRCAGEVPAGTALDFVEQPGPFQQCKFVQRQGLLKPAGPLTRIATGDGDSAVFLVLDFGRALRGYPRLRLSAEAGVIDLGWAQTSDGLCRWISYRCASGYRDWCSPMLARFRYLVLRFSHCKTAMLINCISVMERRRPPLAEGRFDCSGIGVGVWDVGTASLEASRSEVYEVAHTASDWSGVYAQALNDFYQTGDTRTTRATLDCAAQPTSERQLAWLILVAQIHGWYSGETDPARMHLANLGKQLLEASDQLLAAGCAAKVDEIDPTCLAMLAAACRAAASIQRFPGSIGPGERWSARADKLNEILDKFWSTEENRYRSLIAPEENQLLNALILFFGLEDDRRQPDMLVGIQTAGSNETTPLLTRFFEIGGLFEAGAIESAMGGLEQHWSRFQDRNGATWAEKRDEPGTCPGADYFLGSRILGVAPKSLGYETMSIRPHVAGLEFAAGLINTVRGPVEVAWRHQRDLHRFELNLQLDSYGETHICLPRGALRFPTVILNGETVWQNEKVRPNTRVREVISEPRGITLVLAAAGRFQVELQ